MGQQFKYEINYDARQLGYLEFYETALFLLFGAPLGTNVTIR